MIRGIYTSAAGMMVQQTRHDVLSNNLANVNSTGFKRDLATARTFPEMLLHRVHDFSQQEPGQIAKNPPIGSIGTGAQVDGVWTRFGQTGIRETGVKTNLAVEGDGFFVVQTPQGIAYTRDGSFQVNSQNLLVTAEGYPVQGSSGNITLPQGDFSISERGEILVDGQAVDQINLFVVAAGTDPNLTLEKRGDNSFLIRQDAAGGQGALVNAFEGGNAANQPVLRSGFVELSNVNVIKEMVEMIAVSRAYEANQKSIQAQDATLEKACNELGRA